MCVPLPFIVLLLLLLRYEKYCFGRRLSNIKLTLYWWKWACRCAGYKQATAVFRPNTLAATIRRVVSWMTYHLQPQAKGCSQELTASTHCYTNSAKFCWEQSILHVRTIWYINVNILTYVLSLIYTQTHWLCTSLAGRTQSAFCTCKNEATWVVRRLIHLSCTHALIICHC